MPTNVNVDEQFQQAMLLTGEDPSIHSPCIMCVQYIRGCSVHRGDTMSTLGDIMSTSGAIMMHVGDIMMHVGGYHEYIGDVQYIGGIS